MTDCAGRWQLAPGRWMKGRCGADVRMPRGDRQQARGRFDNAHIEGNFLSDVSGNKLATSSFITPAFTGSHPNSMHTPEDLRPAEKLVADVYGALRAREGVWRKPLFIVLFDEHGGYGDHAKPPAAVSPDDLAGRTGQPFVVPFDFKRLCRALSINSSKSQSCPKCASRFTGRSRPKPRKSPPDQCAAGASASMTTTCCAPPRPGSNSAFAGRASRARTIAEVWSIGGAFRDQGSGSLRASRVAIRSAHGCGQRGYQHAGSSR